MLTENELVQKLLITNLPKFVKKGKTYKNLILVNDNSPESSFNKIISCDIKTYEFWTNLTDLQKSFLIPKISLFYVDPKDGEFKPIIFRMYPDFDEAVKFATGEIKEFSIFDQPRMDGSALKRISINNRNERPSDVNIDVKVELFFDNETAFANSNLLRLIATSANRTYTKSKEFRTKLVIGWNTPEDASREIFTPDQISIIEKCNTVYYLQLVTHTFNINQNGTIELSIEYQGAMEKFLSATRRADIFAFLPEDSEKFQNEYKQNTRLITKNVTYYDVIDGPSGYTSALKTEATETSSVYQGPAINTAVLGYIALEKQRKTIEDQLNILWSLKSEERRTADEKNNISDLEKKLEEINEKISQQELLIVKYKYSKILRKLGETNKIYFFPVSLSSIAVLSNEQVQSDASLFKYVSSAALMSSNTKPLISELEEESRENDDESKETTKDFELMQKEMTKYLDLIEVLENIYNKKETKERLKEKSEERIEQLNEELNLQDLSEKLSLEQIDKIKQEASTLAGLDGEKAVLQNFLNIIKSYPFKDQKLISDTENSLASKIQQYKTQRNQVSQTILDISYDNEDLEGVKNFYYITLGDLINVVAEDIVENDMNIIIGPARVGDYLINLCDFPISLKSFEAWFISNVISQSKTSYYLWDFIQDVFTSLVHSNLISFQIAQNRLQLNIQTTSVVSENEISAGTVNDASNLLNKLSPAIFNFNKIYSYMVLYLYDYRIQDRTGELSIDYKDGIYHYYKGLNKGIVKSIKFNKIDFPRYRDMKLMNSRLNQPGEILREHYSAVLEVIASPLFAIGGLLYINATSKGIAGKTISSQLGLSGYYMITGIETNISKDDFTMTIQATWQHQGLEPAANQSILNR